MRIFHSFCYVLGFGFSMHAIIPFGFWAEHKNPGNEWNHSENVNNL